MELYQFVTKFIEIKLSVKDDGHTFGNTTVEINTLFLSIGPTPVKITSVATVDVRLYFVFLMNFLR